MQMFEGDQGAKFRKVVVVVGTLLALFLAVKTVGEIKGLRYIGTGVPAMNTIMVEGDGEAVAIPDTAHFSFSVIEKAASVAVAQEAATKKMQAITAYLEDAGVEDKDIKTIGYSVYPQYDWVQETCAVGVACRPGKSVLSGYEVRQTVEIQVRDTKKAGDLLSGIGSKGASELSGLTFSVEDEDALKAEARGEAIDEAKAKAEMLADKLGVKLVRIVSFNENSGGYPVPYYGYGMGGAVMEKDASPPSSPPVPTGENKISSHVMITYEIR